MSERENGWYWVKFSDDPEDNSGNDWQVGQYENGNWSVVGIDARWSDDEFASIGPRVEKPTDTVSGVISAIKNADPEKLKEMRKGVKIL